MGYVVYPSGTSDGAATLTRFARTPTSAARLIGGARGGDSQRARLLEGDHPRRRRAGLRRRRRSPTSCARPASRARPSTSSSPPRRSASSRPTATASRCSTSAIARPPSARGAATGARSCAPGSAPTSRRSRDEPLFARTYLLEIHAAGARRAAPRATPRCAASPTATARRSRRAARRPALPHPERRRCSSSAPAPSSSCAERAARAARRPLARPRGRLLRDAPRRCSAPSRHRRGGLTMDLTFTDAETAFRDELRAWLAGQPARRRARGRGRQLRLAPRLAAQAARRRLGRRALADRVRRPRRVADRDGDLLRGARPRARAAARQRPRPAARRARRS